MTRASASVEIPAPPEKVWQLIGGFGSLPDWLPYIPKSELSDGGRMRHLATPDGSPLVERLVSFDEKEHTYSYAIVQAPFPVTDYLSTLRVSEADGGAGSRVEWSGQFTPKGASEADAHRLFQGIYENGLAALASAFASKPK